MNIRPAVPRVARFARGPIAAKAAMRARVLAGAVQNGIEYASVTIDSIRYVISTSDPGVGYDLFTRMRRPELIVLPRVVYALDLPAGGCFVDVGANIGTSALPAVLRGGFSSAVCCEPGAESAALLRVNCALNGVSDRVTVVEAAVSDHVGVALLDLSTSGPGTRQVVTAGEAPGEFTHVPTVTLDALAADGTIELEDVGLLWVDAQGHEAQVLAGARSFVERGTPLAVALRPAKLAAANALENFFGLLARGYSRFTDLRAPSLRDRDWAPDWRPVSALGELAEGPRNSDILLV